MKTRIIALLSLSVLLFGCESTSDKTRAGEVAAPVEEHHSHENSDQALELNNGEKWLVNDEMKPFVHKSEQILQDYSAAKATDHVVLAEQLKNENNALIKSCTMTGKSHEELHKWLHPHMELIEALSKEADKEQASMLVSDLKTSFNTYHAYFK
ncbi:hypothetical protein [Pontibacter beigongshangensis]|uniref:hypothetical protein n=1 Tax=Pontibacter beigongshangensis TaxID=2574733 RepID=UPI00164FA65B|nr:hypothetical protein [Pontibacter beigongshangensis]